MLPVAEYAAASRPQPIRPKVPARFHGIPVVWLFVLASMVILGGLASLISRITPTYLIVVILLSPLVGIAIWAAIARPFSLPTISLPARGRVVIAATIVVTTFAGGAAATRLAPIKNPIPHDRVVWMVLCAPSYFAAAFAQSTFKPFPFSVPFALANGALYVLYAAIAMTPRVRWLLIGIPFLHGACGYLLILLAAFSGIRG
jgi:hypothetical protein